MSERFARPPHQNSSQSQPFCFRKDSIASFLQDTHTNAAFARKNGIFFELLGVGALPHKRERLKHELSSTCELIRGCVRPAALPQCRYRHTRTTSWGKTCARTTLRRRLSVGVDSANGARDAEGRHLGEQDPHKIHTHAAGSLNCFVLCLLEASEALKRTCSAGKVGQVRRFRGRRAYRSTETPPHERHMSLRCGWPYQMTCGTVPNRNRAWGWPLRLISS